MCKEACKTAEQLRTAQLDRAQLQATIKQQDKEIMLRASAMGRFEARALLAMELITLALKTELPENAADDLKRAYLHLEKISPDHPESDSW